ncbi:hypothetical protein [Mesorhizobium sp. 43Arga]
MLAQTRDDQLFRKRFLFISDGGNLQWQVTTRNAMAAAAKVIFGLAFVAAMISSGSSAARIVRPRCATGARCSSDTFLMTKPSSRRDRNSKPTFDR